MAVCITDEEFRSQLVEKEAAAKLKAEATALRKELAEKKRMEREIAKVKAQEKRTLAKARKEVEAVRKSNEAAKKKTFKSNKANKICYVCFADPSDFEVDNVRRWRFCSYCGLWCCLECLPQSSAHEDFQSNPFVCNNCATDLS
jgi:flagellar biosynthesis GTPase FlhF